MNELALFRATEAARFAYRGHRASVKRAADLAAELFDVEPAAVLRYAKVAERECAAARSARDGDHDAGE